VITIDGCEPDYLDDALERDLMPRLKDMLASGGTYLRGRGHMPTLTNPNNMSIVCGAPPSVHGISGNHCLFGGRSEPVQLVEPDFLRAPTIHAALHADGASVLCVTAKDKLRKLLGAGGVASVSAEHASQLDLHGTPIADLVGRTPPSIYDWDLSHYAMEIGLAAHKREPIDLLYVSLTDFVQHKEPPGGAMADHFYARFDELLGNYLDAGFLVGITADHGMHAKPRVHFLEDVLSDAGVREFTVVLPITDPYVVHHGALGSFAWIYTDELERATAAVARLDGVEEVLTRDEAALAYEHPPDRIGDLSVAADAETALGQSLSKHDLSHLEGGLRSHGGHHEETVPIIVSRPLPPQRQDLRNSDMHDLLLNGVRQPAAVAAGPDR